MVVDEHCHVKGIVTRKVWKKRGCRQWGGRGVVPREVCRMEGGCCS